MNIPYKCPSCSGKVIVTELCCDECKTSIKGNFELPELACLNEEDDRFLKTFLAARGSIKEMERCLGISYPTVKSRMEALLAKLGLGQLQSEAKRRRLEIVEKLEKGEIPAQEAIKLLNELEK
ncbi:MAG: hypothetical protein A3J79_03270 [Elusimicrobia bacterium RIFOXYB2_FULL_62_6]|nr:MAG: hypothetical protein A3J79_03270 [Elusimicrobia bacterium RIFOXYB2_FULL_62_6]